MKTYILKYCTYVLFIVFLLAACGKKEKADPDNPFLSKNSKTTADLILSDGSEVQFVGGFSLMGMLGNYMLQDEDNPNLYNIVVSFSDGDMIKDIDPKYTIGINLFGVEQGEGSYVFDSEGESMDGKPLLSLTDLSVDGIKDSIAIYYPVLFDGEQSTVRYGDCKVEVTSFKDTKIKGTFSGTVYNLYGGNMDSIVIENGKFEATLNEI